MLRIITLNLNGIRSAHAKGFPRWLARQRADVVCLQEIKAQEADLDGLALVPKGWHGHYECCSTKKGYSGVALYSRKKPDSVACGYGSREFDPEGRYLLAEFTPVLKHLRASGREFVLCGDWNIAHKEIDLENWRGNRKNSGFLPEERAWLTATFDDAGWVDVFRRVDPRPRQYTWWSNRGQAWKKNVGWRIDYQIATPGIAAKAKRASIYKAKRFSDHAPLTIDYDHALR